MLGTVLHCFLIWFLALSQLSQQPHFSVHDCGVRGRVVESYGHSPIRNAYVLAHRNGSADSNVRTDDNGKYAMALPVGIYDVFISADGFSPMTRKVWVRTDGMMIFDAALEFDGLGMEKSRNP